MLAKSFHKELKCEKSRTNSFSPLPHQIRVAREFLETNRRGLLFFHSLGSGKTCSAYLAIDLYRAKNGKKPVFILGPASLASSHQHQYCNVCGDKPMEFNTEFKFYSYNDRQGITRKLPNLNDSIIIIDEVQEILNGKENRSRTLSYVYDAVFKARNVKILLLSGTPVFSVFQSSLLLNLLDPGITSMNPDVYESNIKQKDYLQSKCQGLISYVPVPNKDLYPSRIVPDISEVFQMSETQFEDYKIARTSELKALNDLKKRLTQAIARKNFQEINNLKSIMFIQSTKIKSRQICNFSYPKEYLAGDDKDAKWIHYDHVKELKEYSPKMAKLVHRCLTLPGKHMVYGWFKSKHGLYMIANYLKFCGVKPLLFSGDLGSDEARSHIIDTFNHEDNKRGDIHKVILVSGAGSMGISLFGIRHFHNFEASINEFISLQAEGRAFRTMSHHQLPEDERNVQVYRYFTDLPKDREGNVIQVENESLSTEVQMYKDAIRRMKETENVLDILKRASFDCRESYNSAIKNCFTNESDNRNLMNNEEYNFNVKKKNEDVIQYDQEIEEVFEDSEDSKHYEDEKTPWNTIREWDGEWEQSSLMDKKVENDFIQIDNSKRSFVDFLNTKEVKPQTAFFCVAGYGQRRNPLALERIYPSFIRNSKARHNVTVLIDKDSRDLKLPFDINGEIYRFNEFLPSAREIDNGPLSEIPKDNEVIVALQRFVERVQNSGGLFIFINYVTFRVHRIESLKMFPWLSLFENKSVVLEWTFNSPYLSVMKTPIRFRYNEDEGFFKVILKDGKVIANCDQCESTYSRSLFYNPSQKLYKMPIPENLLDITDEHKLHDIVFASQSWRYRGADDESSD